MLLDQRVRRGGSHHQKLVVLRHPGHRSATSRSPAASTCATAAATTRPPRRPAGRADVQGVRRPPALARRAAGAARPGGRRARPHVPGTLDRPAPLDKLRRSRGSSDKLRGADLTPDPLPDQPPDPPPCGPHPSRCCGPTRRRARRTLRPARRAQLARGYTKAIRRARRLIYLEDQYLWSRASPSCSRGALGDNPELHLVVVVPRHPDVDGRLALPPNQVGRRRRSTCADGRPDRVHVFDVENHAGTPVYVHAKVCVIDDVWASVGSDNFNRRSWTHDSELSCAVLDDTGEFARDLRLRLLREHLDRRC